MNLVDDEEWREYTPGYWVSSYGQMASQWTKSVNSHIDPNKFVLYGKTKKPDNRKGYRGDYIENAIYPFKDNCGSLIEHVIKNRIANGTGHQTTVNPDRIRMSIKRHRAVMDCFKPLDDYSHEIGISKEDWDDTPESSKDFIRRQVYVNHKDHNRTNNHIDNLEWVDVVNNAIKKITNRVDNGDTALNAPHKGKHYSQLTREEKVSLGHLSN